jgi:hypothetical protein
MSVTSHPVVVEEVTDPVELAKARLQRQRFDRNEAWLQAHISQVYSQYRGRFICIAGEELFASDSAQQAIELATAAHPDDDGWFTRFIPPVKLPGVYAI